MHNIFKMYLLFEIVLSIVLVHSTLCSETIISSIRGGYIPQADGVGGDYFEKFQLDYGIVDDTRVAGATRGLIQGGKLLSLPESDPFLKWINEHLEKGPEESNGRIKPYYAADFGSKKDLRKGENPKIIIVNRKLSADENGVLTKPSNEIDVEVRDVWQPWLKKRCDFVVRYIVPNRVNIIKTMAASGRFRGEIHIESTGKGQKTPWAKMIFKPSLIERLKGKRDVVMKRKLDGSVLKYDPPPPAPSSSTNKPKSRTAK